MFLAVDIGNSNIKFGVFDGSTLIFKHKIPTPRELPMADLAAFLPEDFGFPISAALICSVVPEVNSVVVTAVSKRFGITPNVIANDGAFGLTIRHTPLTSAGSDRIIGAFAAAEIFGTPCIVCSFGTALTIDAVNADRVLLGGVIAPGPQIMSRALSANTSRLPEVDLTNAPASIVQTTTAEAIKSGILFGYLGMTKWLIDGVKKECGPDARVIATGGWSEFAAEHLDLIDAVEPDLVLHGLRLCYDRWRS
jgi:type III pantothenate kinase